MNIFKLMGTISINNSDANAKVDETTGKAKSAASALANSFDSLGDGLINVGKTISGVGKSLTTYVTTPIVGLGVSTAKTAISFLSLKENTRTAFKVLLGGAEEAEKMLEDLYTFAKTTPFSYDGYLQAGKALVAMGVSAEDTIPYLDGITNAAIATGAGQEGINTLSSAIGTMSSKGKIQLNELNQMTAMGIPAVKILANQYGKTEEEMYKLISAGKVMAEDALPKLIDGMNNGTEGAAGMTAAYGGLAEESKNTLSGALDTLRSRFRNVSLEMWNAEEAFPALNSVIRTFTDLLNYLPAIFNAVAENAQPVLEMLNEKLIKLKEYMDNADPEMLAKIGTTILKLAAAGPILMVVGSGITKLGKIFKGLGSVLKVVQGAGGIGGLITKLGAVAGPVAIVIGVLGLLVAALGGPKEALAKLREAFDWLMEQVQRAADIISTHFEPVLEKLKEVFDQLVGIVRTVIDIVVDLATEIMASEGTWSAFEGIVEAVAGVFEWLMDVLNEALGVVQTVLSGIADFVRDNMDQIKAYIENVMDVISGIINLVMSIIQGDWSGAWEAIKQIVTGLLNAIWNSIKLIFEAIKKIVINIFNAVKEKVSEIWENIKTAVTDKVNAVKESITNVFNQARDKVAEIFNGIKSSIMEAWENIKTAVTDKVNAVKESITNAFNQARDAVLDIFNGLKDGVSQAFETVKNAITVAIMAIKEIFSAAFQIITLPWRFIWENIKDTVIPIFENIRDFITGIIDTVGNFIGDKLDAIQEFFTNAFTAVSEFVTEKFTAIHDFISEKIEAVSTFVSEKIEAIREFFVNGFTAISEFVTEKFTAIYDFISEKIEAVRSFVADKLTAIQEFFTRAFTAVSNFVKDKSNEIRDNITNKIQEAKDKVSNVIEAMKTAISTKVDAIKTAVKTKFEAIRDGIMKPIEKARDRVKEMIDKIKGFFNFSWSLPKLKLPHFKIDGKFSLNPPSVPKFNIDWYAKGGIMEEPTMFDFNPATGTAKVGGEAGPEAIAPIDTLMDYVRAAVAEQSGNTEYLLDKLVSLLTQYLPAIADNMDRKIVLSNGVLVGELAPEMDKAMGRMAKRKG